LVNASVAQYSFYKRLGFKYFCGVAGLLTIFLLVVSVYYFRREKQFLLQQVDRQARILNGRQVSLTRKEFDLLAYLVEHAGQAVSRDELRRALWGTQELYRWSRAIDVHVQHLRRKLETDAAAGVEIATVTGIGYRLEAVAGDGADA
jgi:hypothetical protein